MYIRTYVFKSYISHNILRIEIQNIPTTFDEYTSQRKQNQVDIYEMV